MKRTTTILATAAAVLALTSCSDDPRTVAEIGCEDLVEEHLDAPDDLSFDHADATQDGDRWAIEGTATWDGGSGDYTCRITVDGNDWTGRVSMVAP